MSLKKYSIQTTLLSSFFFSQSLLAHPGNHEHTVFEQVLTGLGYAALAVTAAVVIKLTAKSKNDK